ncbi:ATP-binding protein [Serratia fonticola]|uniref:ATP-binding protein n=1 Tax=Serratia fonticola TaxID=47917 RepID=UPI002DB8831A|nr:ATP-binding protein [Serratia fonticola]MEB7885471.1 ATP-binding protein [Serratia fonticola]
MNNTGLSRHLTWLLVQVTVTSILLSFLVYYVWYGVTSLITPVDVEDYGATAGDWIMLAISSVLSVMVAVLAAVHFSRKLLLPLNSLADSARKIAGGELSARAQNGDYRLTEISAMVTDFNSMAEKLEKTSGEITTWNAAIAHELRTPVTILQGRLQGLADGIFKPDHELFVNLVKQTQGLARLIEDLRTLSLAENRYMPLHTEDTLLDREIRAVAELMRSSMAESSLSLVLELDDVTLNCDAERIRQALLALLDNAQRYATPGIVRIACYQEKDVVIISIEDEGPGIPDEIRGSLFEPFIRGDQSRSRASGGTGLGLAVVKAIVTAHGGQITCSAGIMGGTRFTLVFNHH